MSITGTRSLSWGFVVTVVVAMAILVSLGTWQVQRLAWKQALIARIEAGLAARPVTLTEALKQWRNGRDIDFLRVQMTGHYRPKPQFRVYSLLDGTSGWELAAFLESDDAGNVIVDRGFVPDDLKDEGVAAVPAGPVELTGVIRLHRGAKALFTPDNNAAANQWFWWDTRAMDIAAGLAPADVPQLVVHRQRAVDDPRWPASTGVDVSAIPNSHLQYAITWYALALVLAVMAFIFARNRLAGPERHDDQRDE